MPSEHAQDPADRPATKPFAQFLQEMREGALHAELSDWLAEITQAALTHGRKGALTLSVTVAPNKGLAGGQATTTTAPPAQEVAG